MLLVTELMMREGGRRVIARGHDADVSSIFRPFHLVTLFYFGPPSHDIATAT